MQDCYLHLGCRIYAEWSLVLVLIITNIKEFQRFSWSKRVSFITVDEIILVKKLVRKRTFENLKRFQSIF